MVTSASISFKTFAQRKPLQIRASGVVQHLQDLHIPCAVARKARRENDAPVMDYRLKSA